MFVCFFSKTLNFLVLLNNEDELILDQYLLQEFQLPWKETLCFSKKKKKNQVWQKKAKVLYLLAILFLISYSKSLDITNLNNTTNARYVCFFKYLSRCWVLFLNCPPELLKYMEQS